MKVSRKIIKQHIDNKALAKALDEFYAIQGYNANYIILNKATNDLFTHDLMSEYPWNAEKVNGPVAMYHGIPIAISENVPYGEVELV